MERAQEIQCFASMLGIDGFDVDGPIPYIVCEPHDSDTRSLIQAFTIPDGWEDRYHKPRIAILGNGLWSPIESPWEGWTVAGYYSLGEGECYMHDPEDPESAAACPYCEGDGILYFGEETIVVLLVPDDTHHSDILTHFARMGLMQAYSIAALYWTDNNPGSKWAPPAPGPGGNWADYLPELDKRDQKDVDKWALEAINDIEESIGETLSAWLAKSGADLDDSKCVERFADCLALAYVGHGVGPYDWAHEYKIEVEFPDLPNGDDSDLFGICETWLDDACAEYEADS